MHFLLVADESCSDRSSSRDPSDAWLPMFGSRKRQFAPSDRQQCRRRLSNRLRWGVFTALMLTGAGCSSEPETKPEAPGSTASSPTTKADDDKLLSLENRKQLWDIEHIAFTIEQSAFPAIKRAFRRADASTLRDFLASDFQGVRGPTDWDTRSIESILVERTASGASEAETAIDADAFVAELLTYRSLFDEGESACSISLGLVRLGPSESGQLNSDWKGIWRAVIKGTSAGRRRELRLRILVSLPPLTEEAVKGRRWIKTARIESAVMTSTTSPKLVEFTEATGIPVDQLHDNWQVENMSNLRGVTGGAFASDYDGDGLVDLLVEDTATGPVLYRGSGQGRFVDVTESAGLAAPTSRPLWTLSCWADFDNDGDPDLIAGDNVYSNNGDGTFRNVTDTCNLPLAPAEGYAVADYDNDGLVDLYVCHSAPYLAGQKSPDKVEWIDGGLGADNVLFRNLGNWQFEDVTQETGTSGGGSACFAAVWIDANGDRLPDLFAINEFGRNSLMINQPNGPFIESTVDPIFGGFSMGVATGDYNNDGTPDLYVANMYSKAGNRILANVNASDYPREMFLKVRDATTGSKLYEGQPDGSFRPIPTDFDASQVGWAYGPCFVDLNADGLLDLYATAGFQSVKRGEPDG